MTFSSRQRRHERTELRQVRRESRAVSARERRRERTRQSILDAALAIVSEEGPKALSMRALAERIDYSPAGLYEYFGSKEEIIGALCEQGHQQLYATMDEVDHKLDLKAYMVGIGLAYVRFAQENAAHFLLMFGTPPPDVQTPEAGLLEEGSAFRILVAGIQRGIAEGVFMARPDFAWLEMAYAAWATVHGLALLRITTLKGTPYDFDVADRQTLDNFYRGLLAAP